jgi:hypothetical protein
LVWYRIYVKIGVYDCMLYRYVYTIYIMIDSSSGAEHKICYSWIHGYDIW